MRKLLLLVTLLGSLNAYAAPASEESVERLLAATRVESMMDSMYAGVEQMMRQAMKQSTQGKPLNAEQQRALDAVAVKFVAMMREELNWQKMKPLYVKLYRDTFEQDEIDGLITFYASPSGQALLNKMPVVIEKSMALSQSLMQSVLPKLMAAMKDAMTEAKIPH
jgi:uncharacterized protein